MSYCSLRAGATITTLVVAQRVACRTENYPAIAESHPVASETAQPAIVVSIGGQFGPRPSHKRRKLPSHQIGNNHR